MAEYSEKFEQALPNYEVLLDRLQIPDITTLPDFNQLLLSAFDQHIIIPTFGHAHELHTDADYYAPHNKMGLNCAVYMTCVALLVAQSRVTCESLQIGLTNTGTRGQIYHAVGLITYSLGEEYFIELKDKSKVPSINHVHYNEGRNNAEFTSCTVVPGGSLLAADLLLCRFSDSATRRRK